MEDLVLLTGENGCGKDFFYKNYKNVHKYFKFEKYFKLIEEANYTRLAFADPIKLSLGCKIQNLTNSGISRQTIINQANKLKFIYGEDYFVDIVIYKIIADKLSHVIITDLRFKNEYDKIKKNFPHARTVAINSNPHSFSIDNICYQIE